MGHAQTTGATLQSCTAHHRGQARLRINKRVSQRKGVKFGKAGHSLRRPSTLVLRIRKMYWKFPSLTKDCRRREEAVTARGAE